MRRNGLNPAFVAGVKPGVKTKRYGDGQGLYLVVTPSGSKGGKSWVQRLSVDGVRRELGLGSVRNVPLRSARRLALENRRIARAGGEPSSRGDSAIPTFGQAFDSVIALRRGGWKNPDEMEAQWRSSMRQYVLGRIGGQRVDAVTAGDLLAALEPIWASNSHAPRMRRRIALVMQWALAQGFRSDDPSGEMLTAALPRVDRRGTPRRALPHGEVASALAKVRKSSAGMSIKLAFEAMVLCAVRSGEARCAMWDEVDFASNIWTIPASRMKGAREHRIPLSRSAAGVFRQAQARQTGELVFPSRKPGVPISRRTFARLTVDLGIAANPHGFRSSFRDWAGECTDAPRTVIESALAHAVGDRTEVAYARSDLLERRRMLMHQWADYLSRIDPARTLE